MDDIQLDKARVVKYLRFLGDLVEGLLAKNSPVSPDDLRSLFNEHTLFVRRINESRWVPDDFKREVNDLADDPLIFGKGVLAVIGRTIETIEEGPYWNDRTSYGPVGPTLIQVLTAYRDRVLGLLEKIETFRFWQ